MKHVIYLLLLLIFTSFSTNRKNKDTCYSDKGIKTARIYIVRNGDSKKGQEKGKEKFRELSFDTSGNVIRMREPMGDDSIAFYYQYENRKLMRTLRTRNRKLWEALDITDMPQEEWITGMDTSKIVSHNDGGLPNELRSWDGGYLTWSYVGCEQEIRKRYSSEGVMLQETTDWKDKGLLELSTTVVHTEPQWTSVTHYFDYKFNRKGHWIKRKYRHGSKAVIVERRELEYY